MPNKIIVIRLGQLGDILLCSPLTLNLKLNFPDSQVTFLTKNRFEAVAKRLPGVDQVIGVDDNISALGLYQQAISLDNDRYDTVIDLQRKLKSWFVRTLLRPDRNYIYPKRRLERQQAIRRNAKITPDEFPHTIDLYNEIIIQMGGQPIVKRPQLNLSQADLIRKHSDLKKIFIAPGASFENKSWGYDRFAQAAHELIKNHNSYITWAVTSAEQKQSDIIDNLDPEKIEILLDQPIDKLISVMTNSDIALTNDSGLMHLATAVGLPVTSIFGPTHQVLGFAPKGLFSQVVEVDLPCRPCSLHGSKDCYRDKQYCFDQLTPAEIVYSLLEQHKSSGRLSKALFVDRDGTLIVEKDFLSDPDQVELIPGVPEALKLASEAGYKIIIISNQSGVARGYFGEEDVEKVNGRVMELLSAHNVEIDGVYYCPYYKNGTVPKYSIESNLRKPGPGMAEAAALDLSLDLRRSIVIGDKLDDYRLGQVIGGRSALVLTGHGQKQWNLHRHSQTIAENNVFENLLKAVQNLLN